MLRSPSGPAYTDWDEAITWEEVDDHAHDIHNMQSAPGYRWQVFWLSTQDGVVPAAAIAHEGLTVRNLSHRLYRAVYTVRGWDAYPTQMDGTTGSAGRARYAARQGGT